MWACTHAAPFYVLKGHMITHSMSELEGDPHGLSAQGQACFLCSGLLDDPAIMWGGTIQGHAANLYLHKRCVFSLTAKLVMDALEFEKQGLTEGETRRGVRSAKAIISTLIALNREIKREEHDNG